MVNDFWDQNGLSSLNDEFTTAANWAATTGLTVGHWPDADMLPLGYIGASKPGGRNSALSHNQQVTVMSLWAVEASPLIFGGNPTYLTGDDWSIALLTNEEVLAIDQDSAGTRAKRVSQQNSTEVWQRDLTGGRKAVALFNRNTSDTTVSVTFSQLGVTGTPVVRDVWHRTDVTGMTTGLSVNVPHDGALLYTLSPPGGNTGGMGGASAGGHPGGGAGPGATGGSGGVVGSSGGAGGRGATGSGGTTAGTGGSGTGGSPNGTGGTSAGQGGSVGTGGAGQSGGAGGGGGGTGGSSGCSCAVASGAATASPGLWLLVAVVLAGRRRRRP
jgi:MYXO-CTERM domain-containing protein